MNGNDAIIRNLQERIDKLEHIFDVVNNLTVEIKQLALETKYIRIEQSKLSERVDVIEHKPEKRYDTIINTVLSTLTGGLVGALMAMLLK